MTPFAEGPETLDELEARLLAGPPKGFATGDPWSECVLAAILAGWEINPNARAWGEPLWRYALRDPHGKIVGWRYCDSAIGVCRDLQIGPFRPLEAAPEEPLRANME